MGRYIYEDERSAVGCPNPGEGGAALLAVGLAVILVSIVVAGAAAAAMGESRMAQDYHRSQRAMAAAEAGAYRALAELRRRLSDDLDERLRLPSTTADDLLAICRQTGVPPRERVELVTGYAYPVSSATTDWTRSGPAAVLAIGNGTAPVRIAETGGGPVVGEFFATIAVRDAGAPAVCSASSDGSGQVSLTLDYAILAVGGSRGTQRRVCFRSPRADACVRWFPAAAAEWQGSFVLGGGAPGGVPVTLAAPPGGPWTVQAADALYDRPHWEETVAP
jgi:hypothetical protein